MNPVIHFEMPYEDGKRVARFYEQVFGWRMDQLGKEMNNYILASTAKPHDTRDTAMKDLARGAIDGGFLKKNQIGLHNIYLWSLEHKISNLPWI